MGYNNRYSLEVKAPKTQVVKFCEECNCVKTGKFCSTCGKELIEKEVDFDISKIDIIIDKFRDFSDDASYMLDSQGYSEEGGNGYNIESDMCKFSKKYPSLLFKLLCEPDSGFDEPSSIQYHKGGLVHKAKTTITYEEYDESKLVKFED